MSESRGILLVLERIRVTLAALKKSELFKNTNTEEGLILTELKDAQTNLRGQVAGAQSLWSTLRPLLKILTSPTVASPFKMTVLESLQVLVSNEDIADFVDDKALESIMNALIR